MLDFLFDPALIAIYGTIGGGLGIKVFEKRFKGRVEVEVTDEKSALDVDPNDHDMCLVWTERYFEYKLVDAGALETVDMTTCNNNSCKNCEGTITARRQRRRQELRLQEQAAKAEEQAAIERRQADVRRERRERHARVEAEQEAARIRNQEALAELKRTQQEAEEAIASARLALVARMKESNNIEKTVISSGTGDIATVHQIYDPETNEYLGSVMVSSGGETVKLNEKLIEPVVKTYPVGLDKDVQQCTPPKKMTPPKKIDLDGLRKVTMSRRVTMLWAGELDEEHVDDLKEFIPILEIHEYLKSGKAPTPRHGYNCKCCDRYTDTRKVLADSAKKHRRKSSEYSA